MPGPEILAAVGLSDEPPRIYYHGTGCRECFNTGYRGRIGVFEILTIDSALRRRISREGGETSETDPKSIPNFVPLAENCRRLVREGITTPEEVNRILAF